MPFRDMREFIALLEQQGELRRISVEVDPAYEIGAVCRTALLTGGYDHNRALFFERPKGYTIPMAVNLLSTRRRYALAMETTPDRLHREYLERTRRPIAPVMVKDGPCKENILLGNEVDLFRFPIPIWNHLDGGPYITFPCHISKDPESGIRNVGMYRALVHNRNTIGILAAPYRHISLQRSKAQARGETLPVAIAIGVDPSIAIATIAEFPFGTDELTMAGAIRGEPIELVPCETVPLEVPATAEIVLEGEYVPDALHEEGPFGEFTGYYGIIVERPMIRIKAITHRHQPIHRGSYVGKPPQESNLMTAICREAEMMREVSLPGLRELYLTDGGCGSFNGVASIDKHFEGYGKMMGLAILGTWGARTLKTLIVVDTDIDPYNWTEVEWALATRVQPHRDVEILRDLVGSTLDPSLPLEERRTGNARTSKMLIDATRYDADTYEIPCFPRQEVWERVKREWKRYGIPV